MFMGSEEVTGSCPANIFYFSLAHSLYVSDGMASETRIHLVLEIKFCIKQASTIDCILISQASAFLGLEKGRNW